MREKVNERNGFGRKNLCVKMSQPRGEDYSAERHAKRGPRSRAAKPHATGLGPMAAQSAAGMRGFLKGEKGGTAERRKRCRIRGNAIPRAGGRRRYLRRRPGWDL